ncbi:MAG: hypothetical protein M3419_07910 [Actinomycetota bacterium]|nr:hypothetical protein [Actinomycetota bacterium]
MVQTAWLWLPWVAILSAGGLVGAWVSWRKGRRGVAVSWLGWATVPWAAYLLGFIALGFRVIDAVGDWATRFAFNPAAWVGVVLAIVSVALITTGTRLRARQPRPPRKPPAARGSSRTGVGAGGTSDPELEDIDAILKRRGIS